MEIVVQRVKEAKVLVDGENVGSIGSGLLLLVGLSRSDSDLNPDQIEKIASKILKLRCFSDSNGKMNLSVTDIKGKILAVSQFTLLANLRKGNRPSFGDAMAPETAEPLFDKFCNRLEESIDVERGIFGADMKVSLLNDGPVTFLMKSEEILGPRK